MGQRAGRRVGRRQAYLPYSSTLTTCLCRLHVRREHVFEDSFYQLRMRSTDEMRAKLKWVVGQGGA